MAFLLQPKYQKQFADAAGTVPVTCSGAADALPTADWLPTHAPGWAPMENYVDNVGDQIKDPTAFLDRAQALATGKQ